MPTHVGGVIDNSIVKKTGKCSELTLKKIQCQRKPEHHQSATDTQLDHRKDSDSTKKLLYCEKLLFNEKFQNNKRNISCLAGGVSSRAGILHCILSAFVRAGAAKA